MIAIIAMGQAAYAAYILKQLLPASPAFTDEELRQESKVHLTVQEEKETPRTGYPRWQRDGFVFEAISWIAARQAHGEHALLKDATSQGLDGLMIELAVDKSEARILERAERWRRPRTGRDLEEQALAALLETLITGLEIFAAHFLGQAIPRPSAGRFESARHAFMRVLELSAAIDDQHRDDLGGHILNAYAGPHHLASLLLASHDGIRSAALTTLPPPDGADPEFWQRWLQYRASTFPFVWPNHRDAIAEGFHQTGKSAVVVLPTGAGKR